MVTLAATNFPNGVRVGSSAGVAATLEIGAYTIPVVAGGTGNLAAGVGTITTGLGGVVSSFVAGMKNQPAAGGTTFGYVAGSATAGGAVVCTAYDAAGVAGTGTFPIYWFATGTA